MRWVPLVFVAACAFAGRAEVEILGVDALEPTVLEAQAVLSLSGDGFPAGHDGVVAFLGTLHRPGRAVFSCEVEMRAHAVSETRLEITPRAEDIAAFGGRGTFEGELQIRFGAMDGAMIWGRAPALLDIFPDRTRRDLAALRSREERGRTLAAELGIVLLDPDPDAADGAGLTVEAVKAGSWAAARGIETGDRIRRWAGVWVRGAHELAKPREPGEVVVRREGRQADARFRLPWSRTVSPSTYPTPLTIGLLLALCAISALLGVAARGEGRQRRIGVTFVVALGALAASLTPPTLGIIAGGALQLVGDSWRDRGKHLWPWALAATMSLALGSFQEGPGALVGSHPELLLLAVGGSGSLMIKGVRERSRWSRIGEALSRGVPVGALAAAVGLGSPWWALALGALVLALHVELAPPPRALSHALVLLGTLVALIVNIGPPELGQALRTLGYAPLIGIGCLLLLRIVRPARTPHIHLYL